MRAWMCVMSGVMRHVANTTQHSHQFLNLSLFRSFIIKPAACVTTYCTKYSMAMDKPKETSKPKVYVTRRIPSIGIDLLKPHCEVTQWDSDVPVPRDELLRQVKGIDALFCILTDKVDEELLDIAGPQLKVIGTMSVGYDHVDVMECKRRSIPVGFTPGVLTDACAEFTVSLLLATSRRVAEGVEAVKCGEWGAWVPLWLCGKQIAGSTIGIVGLGRIGLGVAERLKSFGTSKILYTGHKQKDYAANIAEFVSMDVLLRESDFVVATCAFNEETKELFNKVTFGKMKKGAIFVNTCRGGVVDQDALYESLASGHLGAAGIDVTVPEPLPVDSPLLKLKNCVVTPHIASATVEARTMMSELTARNILAGLNGQTLPEQICIP